MGQDFETPEHLAQIHAQLWQCVQQFGNLSAMQERNRIARDLHDSLGHALTALNIQLQTAKKLWEHDPTQAQRFLSEAHRLGAIAVKEVRQSVSELRADQSETESLETLVQSLLEDFHQTTGVRPAVHIDLSTTLPQEVVTPIYRIIQEALNNIRKYAQATVVAIELRTTATTAYLTIQDNGRGFNLDEVKSGFGLRGMGERIAVLQGQFQIKSTPGAGCLISVAVPIRLQSIEIREQQELPIRLQSIEIREQQELPSMSAPSSPVVVEPRPSFMLASGQAERLERLLTELIGPIAPLLLQTLVPSVSDAEELIETLALHIPVEAQVWFKQQVTLVLAETSLPSQTSAEISSNHVVLDRNFIKKCEQKLTDILGPIAPFLVQKALATQEGVRSPDELIELLAKEIADAQEALKFQKYLSVAK